MGIFALNFWALSSNTYALTHPWAQCGLDEEIVHCETISCPYGDTDGDGACTTADRAASITDMRNSPYCSVPEGRCGSVHYYKRAGKLSCATHLVSKNDSCDISEVTRKKDSVNPRQVLSAVSFSEPKGNEPVSNENQLPQSLALAGLGVIPFGFLGLVGLKRTKES